MLTLVWAGLVQRQCTRESCTILFIIVFELIILSHYAESRTFMRVMVFLHPYLKHSNYREQMNKWNLSYLSNSRQDMQDIVSQKIFSYLTEASQTKQVTSQWLHSSCMWINVSRRLVLHSSLYLFQKNKTAKMKTIYKNVLGNSLTMKYVSSSQIPAIWRLLITKHF